MVPIMEFAVIKTGGKQYLVKEGDTVKIEKFSDKEYKVGDKISFAEVLLTDDGKATNVGEPIVSGVEVSGTVSEAGRGKKVTTMKYKAKVRYRNKKGHRQHFLKVKIDTIK